MFVRLSDAGDLIAKRGWDRPGETAEQIIARLSPEQQVVALLARILEQLEALPDLIEEVLARNEDSVSEGMIKWLRKDDLFTDDDIWRSTLSNRSKRILYASGIRERSKMTLDNVLCERSCGKVAAAELIAWANTPQQNGQQTEDDKEQPR